ncbi:MAG: hypothetical protein IJE09_05415 [Oscillospiraceae bacterium]|nr:hypothetical protein [Oscillospiraceae bacterium]
MSFKKTIKVIFSLVFIAATFLFCFSGPSRETAGGIEYLIGNAKVQLTGGTFSCEAETLDTVITERDIPMLKYFSKLKTADFSGSKCYNEIALWAAEHPEVQVIYSVPLPNGDELRNDTESLDLSWLKTADVAAVSDALKSTDSVKKITLGTLGGEDLDMSALSDLRAAAPNADFDFSVDIGGNVISADAESIDLSQLKKEDALDAAAALACMNKLKSVELGSEKNSSLEWTDIAMLKAAVPEAKFSYSFTLYGKELTLDSEKLDFRGIEAKDKGQALYSVLACMNNCKYLDMDDTGVENEVMGDLCKLFPDIEIVWRVWFGDNYSVRTDVERILASKPSVGGMIYDSSPLQYCTKVKYLDLGHNDELADFSFLANMPDLEVLIISMTMVTDLSPLKNLTKLDYLELNSTFVDDLSPLANCTSIKHMNIAGCPNVKDISPLYGITGMERLWVGCQTPVPEDQIKKMAAAAPNCEINTTTEDPHGECWRYYSYDINIHVWDYVERYQLLRQQLGYDYQEYSFYWLDPLCDLEAPPEHAGQYGKEVYG